MNIEELKWTTDILQVLGWSLSVGSSRGNGEYHILWDSCGPIELVYDKNTSTNNFNVSFSFLFIIKLKWLLIKSVPSIHTGKPLTLHY